MSKSAAWMPIESAPRDGTEIVLGMPGDAFAGFWHDGTQNYWKLEGWFAEMDRGNLLTAKPFNATHWQPLPTPPRHAGERE